MDYWKLQTEKIVNVPKIYDDVRSNTGLDFNGLLQKRCNSSALTHWGWVTHIGLMQKWCNSGALTHWGLVMHVCVSKLAIIGSDDGLAPNRCQAIIWTNAGLLSIGNLGANLCEILIWIQIFSFKEIHWKMLSGKWRLFCLGLNVFTSYLFCTNASILCGGWMWYMILIWFCNDGLGWCKSGCNSTMLAVDLYLPCSNELILCIVEPWDVGSWM